METPSSSYLIWERNVDHAKHARNMRRFWLFYALPLAVILVAVAVFVDVGSAAGVLILFGTIGLLLFVIVWLSGRNRSANATVTLEDRELVWSKRRVPIDQVDRFSTHMTQRSGFAAANSSSVTLTFGAARFLMYDDELVEFLWLDLDEAELPGLRAALEQILPGRWVEQGVIRAF